MSVKKLIGVAVLGSVIAGCVNTKSNYMAATGAREGELPVVTRQDFLAAQTAFRAKRSEFRSTGQIPVDTTNFVDCNFDEKKVQDISGYTEMLRLAQPAKDEKKPSGSLASQVASDSGKAGSSIQAEQSYHWQGGAVLALPENCEVVAENHLAGGTQYLVNSAQLMTVTVNTSVTSYNTITQSYVDNIDDNTRKSMTVSSQKVGGAFFEGMTAKLALSMNNLEDPLFTYRYYNAGESIAMTEVASTPGVFQTQITTELDDGKVRTKSYAGTELTMIHRSRNGRPHGLQEFLKFDLPANCYDNGENVLTANCERF